MPASYIGFDFRLRLSPTGTRIISLEGNSSPGALLSTEAAVRRGKWAVAQALNRVIAWGWGMAEGQKDGLRILPGRRSGRQKSRTVVREFMIGVGAVLALGVIAVGVISVLIVEQTPNQVSAGAFPCNSPDVIAAAEKAIGIKKGLPD